MSNLSTNDVSYIESEISIPKFLKNIKDILECDLDKVPIIYCDDEQEKQNPLFDYIDFYDKENGNNSQKIRDFYYINNEDIKLKLYSFKKIKKEENEYNIIDNYNIITETDPKTKNSYTILLNRRNLLFKEKICNEPYQIYKKFKLHENLLLFILIKKEEIEKVDQKEKEKEKVEKKENDKKLILLIKEKKKKDKKDNKEEEEDEFGNDKNKNFIYYPDPYYHVFYKYYNFNFEIPQVGENVYCYLLNKIEKELIIFYFWHETKIYIFKIENINDESYEVITKYIFNLDFEPIFICPIKIIIENKSIFLKDIVFYTELFLVITKEEPKICKCIEEKGKLAICNAKYVFKRNDDKELFKGKNINEVEHLDNGLVALHFKEK